MKTKKQGCLKENGATHVNISVVDKFPEGKEKGWEDAMETEFASLAAHPTYIGITSEEVRRTYYSHGDATNNYPRGVGYMFETRFPRKDAAHQKGKRVLL